MPRIHKIFNSLLAYWGIRFAFRLSFLIHLSFFYVILLNPHTADGEGSAEPS